MITFDYFSIAGTTISSGTAVHQSLSVGSQLQTAAAKTDAYIPYRFPITFSNLSIDIQSNAITATSTFAFRNNGVIGTQSVSIGASTTGQFTDASGTDTIASGDQIDTTFTPGATGTSIATGIFGVTSNLPNTNIVLYNASWSGSPVATTNYYMCLCGGSSLNTTEAPCQVTMRDAGKLSHGWINVRTANGSTTTFGTRINSSNGNVAVSITASTTGIFEDTTHSDIVKSGDLVNTYWTSGSSITSWSGNFGVCFQPNLTAPTVCGGIGGISFGTTTQYIPIAGSLSTGPSTIESDVKAIFRDSHTVSNMSCYVTSNAATSGNGTLTLRKNAADAGSTISIPHGTTGAFEDSSSTVSYVAGDAVNMKMVGLSTNIAMTFAAVHVSLPTPPVHGNHGAYPISSTWVWPRNRHELLWSHTDMGSIVMNRFFFGSVLGAGSSAGVATISGVGTFITGSAGTAAGTSAVTAISGEVGSSAGIAAATATGISTAASPASSAGIAAVTSTGISTAASPASSAGIAAATAVGAPIFSGVGSSVGTATATAVALTNSVGSSAGIAAATATGISTAASPASSAGVGTPTAVGALTATAAGSSSGIATAGGWGDAVDPTTGSSSGISTAAAAAVSTATSPASSIGIGAASAIGSSTVASPASSIGIAAASAVGVAKFLAQATSTGLAAVTSIGAAVFSSIAAAAGVAIAAATSISTTTADGSSTGTSSVSSAGVSVFNGVGSSDGAAIGDAPSQVLCLAIGFSEGANDVEGSGYGQVFIQIVGASTGTASAHAHGGGLGPMIPSSAEPAPIEQITDSKKLQADAYIDLFQIRLADNATVIYLKSNNTVTWQGNEYEGTAVKITGVATYADTQSSRPQFQVLNPEGVYSFLIDQGLLNNATIVRIRVLKEHLDEDIPVYRREQWRLARIVTLTNQYAIMELRDMLDGQMFVAPGRMYIPPDFPIVSLQ